MTRHARVLARVIANGFVFITAKLYAFTTGCVISMSRNTATYTSPDWYLTYRGLL